MYYEPPKKFHPGGDQVKLLRPGNDVHRDVKAVVLQEVAAADGDLGVHRMQVCAFSMGYKLVTRTSELHLGRKWRVDSTCKWGTFAPFPVRAYPTQV